MTNPVNADGLSIADLVNAQGDISFTPQSNAGAVGAEVSVGGGGAAAPATTAAADAAVTTAVADAAATTAIAATTAAADPVATTAAAAVTPVTTAAAPAATGNADTTPATSSNLQTFTGDLGAAADPITNSGDAKRPFEVNGATFVNFAAAAARTCDIQFNACANAANGGQGIAFADCNTQKTACGAAQSSAAVTSFGTAAAALALKRETTAGTAAGAWTNSRLRRREEAQKRAERSKKMTLIRTIRHKRAELAVLEEQLL